MYSKPGYIHFTHRYITPLVYCVHSPKMHTHYLDKLDAVGSFRRRKHRLSSEAEEEELSLTEYIRRKQEEENAGPKKKRVCKSEH